MAENNMASALAAAGSTNRFKEAVCIEVGRIFDSCSDKDCLEDLHVFFTAEGQRTLNCSTMLKCKSAEVMDVYLTVEPVSFNRGFYTVDMTFYFRICFGAYASPVSAPVLVTGLAYYCKKVILFGSEGSVKTFSSDNCNACATSNLPTATVKTAEPICLGSRIVDVIPCYAEPIGEIPADISKMYDGELIVPQHGSKVAMVTLGLFTIVTLARDVQIMIPAYDYCVPEKECVTSVPTEDPCEAFKRIKFPVEDFFPEDLNDSSNCDS